MKALTFLILACCTGGCLPLPAPAAAPVTPLGGYFAQPEPVSNVREWVLAMFRAKEANEILFDREQLGKAYSVRARVESIRARYLHLEDGVVCQVAEFSRTVEDYRNKVDYEPLEMHNQQVLMAKKVGDVVTVVGLLSSVQNSPLDIPPDPSAYLSPCGVDL